MKITTQLQDAKPTFDSGKMILGSVTVVITFQEPDNYFGGQVILTHDDDNIDFTTPEEKLSELAIEKAKLLIANSDVRKEVM